MIPVNLAAWVQRHQISFQALQELALIVGVLPADPNPADAGRDEAYVQSKARLDAARAGDLLFRNNVGAGKVNGEGFMRWGLANESKAVNEKVKSADLIGIHKVLVTPEMVGTTIGQFDSLECKEPGWTYSGTPREQAQLAWAHLVVANGGRASFTTGDGRL